MVVVFPAPFVPIRPNTPGCSIEKLMASTAFFSPNDLLTCRTVKPIVFLLLPVLPSLYRMAAAYAIFLKEI